MKDDECNILQSLSREEFREFRTLVIDMVLATDMSFHFQQLKNMKNLLTLAEPRFHLLNLLDVVYWHPVTSWCYLPWVIISSSFHYYYYVPRDPLMATYFLMLTKSQCVSCMMSASTSSNLSLAKYNFSVNEYISVGGQNLSCSFIIAFCSRGLFSAPVKAKFSLMVHYSACNDNLQCRSLLPTPACSCMSHLQVLPTAVTTVIYTAVQEWLALC